MYDHSIVYCCISSLARARVLALPQRGAHRGVHVRSSGVWCLRMWCLIIIADSRTLTSRLAKARKHLGRRLEVSKRRRALQRSCMHDVHLCLCGPQAPLGKDF